jgi:quercetin dioxygenase-like cupin family protein
MKNVLMVTTLLGGVFVFGNTIAYAQHDNVMVMPSELKWANAASLPPGAQIAVIQGPLTEAVPFVARVKFAPNTKVPAHSHSAIEHVTVLSGVLNFGHGDKLDTSKTKPLTPGSVSVMQPKMNHFAWTGSEETIIQLHGVGPWTVTYVDPADDPRKKVDAAPATR